MALLEMANDTRRPFHRTPAGWEPAGWDVDDDTALNVLAGLEPYDTASVIDALTIMEAAGGPVDLLEASTHLPHDADSPARQRASESDDPVELTSLAYHPGDLVRSSVSINANTPSWAIAYLAQTKFARNRRGAASHRNLPADLIPVLAADTSWEPRARVASRDDTPVDVLRSLANDPEPRGRIVSRVAKNKNTPPDLLHTIAEHALTLDGIARREILRALVSRKDLPADTLRIIADAGEGQAESKARTRLAGSGSKSTLKPYDFEVLADAVNRLREHGIVDVRPNYGIQINAESPLLMAAANHREAHRLYTDAVNRGEAPDLRGKFRHLWVGFGYTLLCEDAIGRLEKKGYCTRLHDNVIGFSDEQWAKATAAIPAD